LHCAKLGKDRNTSNFLALYRASRARTWLVTIAIRNQRQVRPNFLSDKYADPSIIEVTALLPYFPNIAGERLRGPYLQTVTPSAQCLFLPIIGRELHYNRVCRHLRRGQHSCIKRTDEQYTQRYITNNPKIRPLAS
jgi:hypothetical protein